MRVLKRSIGKRVYGSIYVHKDALDLLDERDQERIRSAVQIVATTAWNVVRASEGSVTLLEYEDFDAAQFPSLLRATLVDLSTGRCSSTDYRRSANPLILHRKEQLVRPDHPRREAWTAVTATLEERGLFSEPGRIGRQQHWNAILSAAGFDPEGRRR